MTRRPSDREPYSQVRKTRQVDWPRSWANFSLFELYSHRNAWVNLRLLGRPNTFLAPVGARLRAAAKGDDVAALLALLEGEGGRAAAEEGDGDGWRSRGR